MYEPPDDRYDDVLRQVSDALRRLGVVDPTAEEQLLAGVRDALQAMGDDDEDGPGADLRALEDRPDLRVVDTEEAERIAFASDPFAGPRPLTAENRVHVVRATVPGERAASLPAQGAIRARRVEGERPWQTVYRGEAVRAYRVSCDEGQLELAVDGATIERMGPGQTVDVEARVIRVRSAGAGDALGRYVRL